MPIRSARRLPPARPRRRLPAAAAPLIAALALGGVALVASGIGSGAARSDVGSGPIRDAVLPDVVAVAGSAGQRPSAADGGSAMPLSQPSNGPGSAGPSNAPGDPTTAPPAPRGRFPGGLLIADRGNGRLLVVDDSHRVVWSFPVRGSLPSGQSFSADDAFLAPDGKTIVANDEAHQVIDRIDIATRRVVWQYGAYDRPGRGRGQLHTPDDAYPLANGDIVVADIRNCRILEIDGAKRIVRTWGRAGVCVHHPPSTFDNPNGDTPLPDGGLLITEIGGSRIVRLRADGSVVFDIHAPVAYPSDAQLAADGSVIVVDYSNPGSVVRLSATGRVLWRYRLRSGPGRLDHPSLAVPLPDGSIVLNDDGRDRVVVIDPRTMRIVWQYGRTDRSSGHAGSLRVPDGIDVLPVGIFPHA